MRKPSQAQSAGETFRNEQILFSEKSHDIVCLFLNPREARRIAARTRTTALGRERPGPRSWILILTATSWLQALD